MKMSCSYSRYEISTRDRAVIQLDVLMVETLHGARESKRRAFADAAHVPQVSKNENQCSARETISDVNGCATAAELDEGPSTPFERHRSAGVAFERRFLVLLELAVKQDRG